MKSPKKPKLKAAKAAHQSAQIKAAAEAPPSNPISESKPQAKTPAPLEIPPILLEGDAPSAPPLSGPGQRFALGPAGIRESAAASGESGELPEAYGTRRLHLTARDPHWLYAHWDLTREQLKEYNALSKDRHLVLRLYKNALGGKPANEIHVHPESRNWFANVDQGGAKYLAELGYYSRESGDWVAVCTSAETLTPPDSMSDD